jgi:hypothetical protein
MMLLKFLSNCRADGRSFMIGEVAEVGQGVANELLSLGRAEIAPEPEEAPEPIKPASRRGAKPVTPTED